MRTMKAVVFKGKDQIALEEVPRPQPRPGEAVIRTTTICGTEVHIRGDYSVKSGLILGHEPVGVIEELGAGLEDLYAVGQRVIVGAITPCGRCFCCLNGCHSQCGGALGGWKFGNTINGAWAESLLVPDAKANLAPIPRGLADEDVVLCPDIFSTGLSGAESGNLKFRILTRAPRRGARRAARSRARDVSPSAPDMGLCARRVLRRSPSAAAPSRSGRACRSR
jgi:alcohol dehydrogenase